MSHQAKKPTIFARDITSKDNGDLVLTISTGSNAAEKGDSDGVKEPNDVPTSTIEDDSFASLHQITSKSSVFSRLSTSLKSSETDFNKSHPVHQPENVTTTSKYNETRETNFSSAKTCLGEKDSEKSIEPQTKRIKYKLTDLQQEAVPVSISAENHTDALAPTNENTAKSSVNETLPDTGTSSIASAQSLMSQARLQMSISDRLRNRPMTRPKITQLKDHAPVKVKALFPMKNLTDHPMQLPTTTTCTQCLEFGSKLEALQAHSKAQKGRIEQMQTNLKEKEEKIKQLSEENEKIEKKLKKKKKAYKDLEDDFEELNEKYKDAHSEYKRLNKENKKLRGETTASTEDELEHLRKDVMQVRMRNLELEKMHRQQEETLLEYSELLRKLGYRITSYMPQNQQN